ncbi:tetratricopeptide repeat protein [Bizionia hallyeonensis]|uniref:Tetratricopeptide repeat protein n=1 Tax=Bizionia hallyeonensis TaxID=1123757 RepID=A0ABW0C8S5_9FLAO
MKRAIYISILVLIFSCKNEKKERNPLVVAYQEKGIEYEMENKTDSAIVFYKKAIEIAPTDITTIESLTKTYWRNEQPELALEILNKVPSEIKQFNSILTLKGMTLEKMDKLNESMELYKKAFEQSPKIRYKNEENLMEFIGYLMLQTIVGEKEQALAEFDRMKEKKLTESEKQYIKSIQPLIENYKGGGYNAIFGNEQ